ncbi:response regulator transcription factor [Luteolibacter sp. AS25]|uniref:response regulator transcription factor n=1 Tax=Luteolibacter sp. AS25 TaxID=3135776 RepID=UPI00398B5C9D
MIKKTNILILDHGYDVGKKLKEIPEYELTNSEGYSCLDEIVHQGFPSVPSCLILGETSSEDQSQLEVVAAVKQLRWRIPILVLVKEWDLKSIGAIYRAGACDVLEYPLKLGDFVGAVRRVIHVANLNFELASAVMDAKNRLQRLKSKEREIVRMVSSGFLNKEIAEKLDLALVTVKVYRATAMKKLGAGNPAEMVKVAVLGGLNLNI